MTLNNQQKWGNYGGESKFMTVTHFGLCSNMLFIFGFAKRVSPCYKLYGNNS